MAKHWVLTQLRGSENCSCSFLSAGWSCSFENHWAITAQSLCPGCVLYFEEALGHARD